MYSSSKEKFVNETFTKTFSENLQGMFSENWI